MNKTMQLKITDSAINNQAKNLNIRRLNDTNSELQFHYFKDRSKGAWHIVTTINRQEVSKKLANYPAIKTAAARKFLEKKLIDLTNDCNAIVQVSEFFTIGDLLDWHKFRARKLKLTDKRKANIVSLIDNQLLPFINTVEINELTEDKAHSIIDEKLILPLFDEYALSTCKAAFTVLKTAFKTAKQQKRIPCNPIANVSFSDFTHLKIRPREPNVSIENLETVLTQISNSVGLPRLFAYLILANGTRIGETRQARFDHINIESKIWRIPSTQTKTAEQHTIPLTPLSIALLSEIRSYNLPYDGVYLFPSQNAKTARPWNEVEANDAIQQVSGRKWTARDERNLARTGFEKVGDWATGERLVNHSLGVMDKTYVGESAIWERKTIVLTAWHDYILLNDKTGVLNRIMTGCAQNDNLFKANDNAA